MRICENTYHKGNPKKSHGKGSWWLKDPEWELWCPNCVKKWWKGKLKAEMIRYTRERLNEGGKDA